MPQTRRRSRGRAPLRSSDERGVLKAITPLQTLVEKKDGTVTVANGVFLDQTIRR